MGDARLAEQVSAWLRDVRFRPQGEYVNTPMPTKNDIKVLCRGNMVSVWRFLMEHVRPAEEAEHVRANLYVHGHRREAVASTLRPHLDKRDRLARGVADNRAQVARVSSEMQKLRAEVAEAEAAVRALEASIREQQHRAVLVEGALEQSGQLARHVHEFAGQFREAEEHVKRHNAAVERQRRAGGDGTPGDESAALYFGGGGVDTAEVLSHGEKVVRDTVGDVRDQLYGLHHLVEKDVPGLTPFDAAAGNGTGPDPLYPPLSGSRDALASVFGHLDTAIKDKVSGLALQPVDITRAMIGVMSAAVEQLDAETRDLDLRREAELVRESLAREGREGVANTVGLLLAERQREHVDRFMDTERALNEAAALEQKVERLLFGLRSESTAHLDGDDKARRSVVNAFKELHRAEVELEAERAAREVVDERIRSIRSAVADKEALMGALTEWNERIDRLNTCSLDKQRLIQHLSVEIAKHRDRVDAKQTALTQYISGEVYPFGPMIANAVADLQDAASTELNRFVGIPLRYFVLTRLPHGEARPSFRLSIHDHAHANYLHRMLLSTLRLGPQSAPERIFHKIMELREDVHRLRSTILWVRGNEAHHQRDAQYKRVCDDAKLRDLRTRMGDIEATQRQVWRPAIDARVKEARRGLSEAAKLADLVQVWYTQPAQFLVPWCKLDGKTIEEWLTEWNGMCATLRQARR